MEIEFQKLDNNGNVMQEKLVKRIKLSLTKPSTLLVLLLRLVPWL